MNQAVQTRGIDAARLSLSARQTRCDRKTIRRCFERGLEGPNAGHRKPRQTLSDPFTSYLCERVAAYPGLTAKSPRRRQ